jgi:hypothetical protein
MPCLTLRGRSVVCDSAARPRNDVLVRVRHTLWGPMVRLKRDADLQRRRLT